MWFRILTYVVPVAEQEISARRRRCNVCASAFPEGLPCLVKAHLRLHLRVLLDDDILDFAVVLLNC